MSSLMHTTWRTLRNEIGAHEGLFGLTVSATDCAALLTASPTCEEEFAQVLHYHMTAMCIIPTEIQKAKMANRCTNRQRWPQQIYLNFFLLNVPVMLNNTC